MMQPARILARPAAAAAVLRRPRPSSAFICLGCLSRQQGQQQPSQPQSQPPRRHFSRSVRRPGPAPPTAPPSSGIAQLTSRRLISIAGPDVTKYLQGVITANLTPSSSPSPVSPGGSSPGFYGAFLTAKGRVLYDVFIYPTPQADAKKGGDAYLIEVDAAHADRLVSHIKRYKLRAKFDVRLLDAQELSVWHAWDDSTPSTNPTAWDGLDSATLPVAMRDTRTPTLGWRLVVAGAHAPQADNAQLPEDAYTLRRYLQGVPEGQDEMLHDAALPLESNLDVMDGVDFRKGCYVGQELTIRTKHRGVVRKRILPCVLYGAGQPVPTHLVYKPAVETGVDVGPDGSFSAEMVPAERRIGRVGKKDRRAGKWLKGLGNVGLALCKLEVMTDISVPGETAAAGWTEDSEFFVEGGEGGEEDGEGAQRLRVKAFVPEWLRARLSGETGH
ncbi:putative transferase CAF17, mitochondrial [Podospora appendiculata]|uniref:Iron-sulfur cluster assembly factor IBA57 homolog, mitochondrial n=1 Tax=Podospora appendiculata TaxID=314037 RepID=A0AAE1C8D7_9PEZI|nr:putative transferase CAF17, mitochondrial [Podospora appendiculata]